VVRFVYIPHVSITVPYNGWFHGFSMIITEITLQWWRMHDNIFTFQLSFQTMAVKLPFTLICRSPLFVFTVCPKFFGNLFLFGLTVPQQFIVLVCKSSTNTGDEIVHVQFVSNMFNPCCKS
jgi:hypothetical protein